MDKTKTFSVVSTGPRRVDMFAAISPRGEVTVVGTTPDEAWGALARRFNGHPDDYKNYGWTVKPVVVEVKQ